MGTVRSTAGTIVAASPDRVWRIVGDLSYWSEWHPVHHRWTTRPPNLSTIGATAGEEITLFGMHHIIEWRISGYRPPTTLVLAGRGLADLSIDYTTRIHSVLGGLAAHVELDVEFTGPSLDAIDTTGMTLTLDREVRSVAAKLARLSTAPPEAALT